MLERRALFGAEHLGTDEEVKAELTALDAEEAAEAEAEREEAEAAAAQSKRASLFCLAKRADYSGSSATAGPKSSIRVSAFSRSSAIFSSSSTSPDEIVLRISSACSAIS